MEKQIERLSVAPENNLLIEEGTMLYDPQLGYSPYIVRGHAADGLVIEMDSDSTVCAPAPWSQLTGLQFTPATN